MGFDVSYHPVDVPFIHDRLLTCVTGNEDIDGLGNMIARLAQLRFRANAWGLGVLKACQPTNPKPIKKKSGLFSRLFGKGQTREPETAQESSAQFEADLYVWGRPFFITCQTPAEVSAVIDRYMQADLDTVDDIARDMVRTFDSKLLDKVRPDMTGEPPVIEAVREDVRRQFEQLKEAWHACGTGKTVISPDGEQTKPEEFLAHFLPLTIFTMAAHFRPGWMARGHVWPTLMLTKAKLNCQEFFGPATHLFRPLIERVPEIGKFLEPTITSNYTIGGFVPAEKVQSLTKYLETHRDRILMPAAQEDSAEYSALCLKKILEALQDASCRGAGFAEASEVYSAPMGVMN
jgi:hypothetical protein